MPGEPRGRTVTAIYTASNGGAPMRPAERVMARTGLGLEDDRYALGTGAYSSSTRETIRHITLIALEDIEVANAEANTHYSEAETRRNIVTKGVVLNGLVGVRFVVGGATLRGVELCTPCTRPEILCGKRGFNDAFQNRGGLRAEVLSGGLIRAGDPVALSNDQVAWSAAVPGSPNPTPRVG